MEGGNQSFSCVLCNSKLSTKELLQEHFRKHANKEIDNKGRPILKPTPIINDDDISEICTKEVIECDVCKMTFHTVTQAIQHKFRKHPESSSKFYCPFCGMQFPLKFTRDKHVQNHQGMSSLGSFPCSDCSVIFHNMGAQQYHIKSVHKRIASMFKPIPTPPPSKKIKINSANEVHSVYYCYLCGTEYVIKFNLQKHLERSHPEEERNSVPTDLIKCTTCEALFYNKKAYDTHNIYHKPDDLYVTSEEQRLQTVTRVDQDFDIRRVQLTAEKFIPSNKPRRQLPKKIESKMNKKPFKSDLDEELSPTSSVNSTDDETEIQKNRNSTPTNLSPNKDIEIDIKTNEVQIKAETTPNNSTKTEVQKSENCKTESEKGPSLEINSSLQSCSGSKTTEEKTIESSENPEQSEKNVSRKRSCQTTHISKQNFSKNNERQLETVYLHSQESKTPKKVVKKINQKRKSPQVSQISEEKLKMATGNDITIPTTRNDVISSTGNVKEIKMDAISNENNANSNISKSKKAKMDSKLNNEEESEKNEKNVPLTVLSDSDYDEKGAKFERKSPQTKNLSGKKVLKNKNSNTIVTDKSFEEPTSVKKSPRNLRTRSVNNETKSPILKNKINKPQSKASNSSKPKIIKEVVKQNLDETSPQSNSRTTRSQMKSSPTPKINSKQKKVTEIPKKKKLR